MKEIKTCDEINAKICGLLKLRRDKVSVYAAQRIMDLEAENKRLIEVAEEQKSIAEHEHATQMEWFNQASEYKSENIKLREKLKNAVILPCNVGDSIYSTLFGNVREEWKVKSIYIGEEDVSFTAYANGNWKFNLKDYNKTWFTDIDKAIKVQEVKNGQHK